MSQERDSTTAMILPGMGPSRFADVGRFMMVDRFARPLVKIADEVLGYSLVDRFRDTEGDYSEYAQVAFLVNCLALARHAEQEHGIRPATCLGPSFGEKTAAAYAGSLSTEDAVLMTARMARCLEEYFAREHRDVVTHSFVRTPESRLREILAELDASGEWYDISCYLDDDFFMLSLRETRLEWLQQRVRAAGGLPLYTMRPPMHSAAFEPLRTMVEEVAFEGLRFGDPTLPVVSDQDGELVTTADGVRTLLLDGIVRPLRWPESVATLRRLGVTKVCVAGPDSLFGRVRTTTANFEVLTVDPRTAMRPRPRGVAAAGAV
ncbi:ACP S-malonyltransferase [Streptomyces sp. NPDC058155]|uniref:ACP S-malonyltransferase n=1 Tax=Streptomyces sp. NPDC058155 TaxID=3346359 RepID=UPI0036EBFEA9